MAISTISGSKELEKTLLNLDEEHFNELKSIKIEPSKLQSHFVAFANTDGGDLYVGIEDKKFKGERVVGYRNREEANEVIRVLLTETNPSIEGVELEFFDFGKRGFILHFSIPKSPRVHYTSSGECFVRLNASTNKIKGDRITQLGYAKGSYSYERTTLSTVRYEDILNSPHFIDYLQRIDANLDPLSFLKKQRLILENKGVFSPTVACILLFDEEPQATLDTRCAIKVYRLHTTDKEYKREYLKDIQPNTIEGPVELQIHKVIDKVNETLRDVSYTIDGKLVKLNYPGETLKELLVNAVIHRDYSINDDIHIRIYDNRIEIVSPGKLPGYITKDNILEERYSRNPNIVRMLHKLPNPVNHDIGEGLNTAYNAMNRAGLVSPQIQELENAVTVTVEHRRIASLEAIIMDYLDKNEYITNKIVRQLSGEGSENKVKKAFQKLRKENRIEPINPDASRFEYKYRKT